MTIDLYICIHRLLPMKKSAATSVMVYIHHDAGDSHVDPKATSDQVHKQVSGLPKEQY